MIKTLTTISLNILVPMILFLGGIILTLVYQPKYPLTILNYEYGQSSINNFEFKELLAGDNYQATFVSKENNMGTISIRFYTYYRDNSDTLLFRLRQVGQTEWYYQNQYNVNQFQPNQLFPIGFPTIADSKDKQYEFQVVSLKGVENDAVAISPNYPVFSTLHKYDKSDLVSSPLKAISFIYKKVATNFMSIDQIGTTILYQFPFIIYISVLYAFQFKTPKQKYHSYRGKLAVVVKNASTFYLPQTSFLILLTFEAIFLPIFNFPIQLVIVIAWLYLIRIYKLTSKQSFQMSFYCLLIGILLLVFKIQHGAENMTIATYFLLIIATVQSIIELRQIYKLK